MVLAVVRWAWLALRVPLNIVANQIYCIVRDQKYLVGKKLRSIAHRNNDDGTPAAQRLHGTIA